MKYFIEIIATLYDFLAEIICFEIIEKCFEFRFVAISNHIFRIVVEKSMKMTLINNKY